jgi:hypothetical protein
MKQKVRRVGLLIAALTIWIPARSAMGQIASPSAPGQDAVLSMTGTVVSSSPNTVTVRSENGLYVVYIFERYTRKPPTLSAGTMVTVVSTPTGEQGVRVATDILLYTPPVPGQPAAAPAAPKEATETPAGSARGSAERAVHPYDSGEAVPVSVRKLEGAIEKQSRKLSMGFRTGVGLDPELMLVGVHARLGPFFSRNFSFRPNVDFGFGEVTKLFAIDLNGVYRLPLNARQSRWSMFVGAGPNLSFVHRNFEAVEAGNDKIDFGDLDFQSGLNILTGVEFRSGFFVEAKTTVWAGPHLRLTVGYSF